MKKKTYNYIIVCLFCGFVIALLLASFLIPDRSFSQRENRYLQTLPTFSWQRLFDGKFTSDFEDYCADQFPFRDGWITLNARYEQLSGKKQTNGVYLCGDRLITPFKTPSAAELNRRFTAVKLLDESCEMPVHLALIPNAAEIYQDRLPVGAPDDSQAAVIAQAADYGLSPAPLLPMLDGHKEEEIFYRTDHHWTTLGAYYAYTALCETLELEPQSLESFRPETVSDNFYGTAYSSSGYTWVQPDHIERFVDESTAESVTSYRSGSPVEGGLYREESLSQKDQYTYFLGGNTPEIVLTSTHSELPRLVMVRDSYSDCLVPFLLAHYSEIRMLDLRYFLGSVKEYATEHQADAILVIYSVENFCKESSVIAMMTDCN